MDGLEDWGRWSGRREMSLHAAQDWADDEQLLLGPGLCTPAAAAALAPWDWAPWQWAQCMQSAQFPSFWASTARNLSAGPSFMFMVPVRWSSLSSGSAVPSMDCSRKHCATTKNDTRTIIIFVQIAIIINSNTNKSRKN